MTDLRTVFVAVCALAMAMVQVGAADAQESPSNRGVTDAGALIAMEFARGTATSLELVEVDWGQHESWERVTSPSRTTTAPPAGAWATSTLHSRTAAASSSRWRVTPSSKSS